MILYLIRHAKAEDSNPQGDRYRELSAKGISRIRSLLPVLKERNFSAGIWLSSPYIRARQTAEYFTEAFSHEGPLEVSSSLTPDGDTSDAISEFQSLTGGSGASLAVFSHNPFISELSLNLISPQDPHISQITFHTPSVLALDFPTVPTLRQGRFLWILHPVDRT